MKAAQEMAQKRWRGTTSEERSEHAKMMGEKAAKALTPQERSQRAKKAAAEGPVFITDRGRPAHVLLTIEDYQRLGGEIAMRPHRPCAWPSTASSALDNCCRAAYQRLVF